MESFQPLTRWNFRCATPHCRCGGFGRHPPFRGMPSFSSASSRLLVEKVARQVQQRGQYLVGCLVLVSSIHHQRLQKSYGLVPPCLVPDVELETSSLQSWESGNRPPGSVKKRPRCLVHSRRVSEARRARRFEGRTSVGRRRNGNARY